MTRWFCFVFVALAGCSAHSGTQSRSDPGRATAALQSALDAWKKGVKPSAIKGPVSTITDPDWNDGARLLDYMIYNTEGQPGAEIRCGVALILLDRQNRKLTKDVVYSLRGSDSFEISREPQ